MKRLNFDTGGKPLFADDIEILQSNVYEAITSNYKGKGAFIIQGCTVVGNDIGTGIVIINDEIRTFSGATNVSFPIYLKAKDVNEQLDQYADSNNVYAHKNKIAVHSNSIPASGEYITVTSSGGRTYHTDVLGENLVKLQGNQTISGSKTMTNNLTVNGTLTNQGVSVRNASILNSGTLSTARIPDLNADKIYGTLHSDRIPNLNADKITSGTLGISRIPSLSADKIIAGTFDTDRIPNLNANKVTSGMFSTDRIPNLSASKITSGTINLNRIPTIPDSKLDNKKVTVHSSTPQLATKVIEIGSWNMNTTSGKYISHGLDDSKIRSVYVVIKRDSGSTIPLDYVINETTDTRNGFWQWNSSFIILARLNGGTFDSSLYESSGINRGWITIVYED